MRGLRSAWLALSMGAVWACGPSSVGGNGDAGEEPPPGDTDGGRPDAGPRPDARIVMPPPPLEIDWPYDDPGADEAVREDGLPDDVRDWFEEPPTTSGAPELVYPLDGSMHPHNLPNIAFQWKRGATTSRAFRLQFEADGKKLRFYLACATANCEKDIESQYWLDLGRRFAGKEVVVTVAGSAGATGPVTQGPERTIFFSPSPVLGAVYYWAAEARTIKRANLGGGKAVPFIVPNSATNDYACVACHSVSRNGEVIAFAVSPLAGENIAAIQAAPTEMPEMPFQRPPEGVSPFPPVLRDDGAITRGPTSHFGHNVALSPDGEIAAINGIDQTGWPPYFELRNTRAGTTIMRWSLGDTAFGGANLLPIFPEWSPDGTQLAVTLADATGDSETHGCVWTSETCRSSIAVIAVNGSTLGTPRVLVAGSGNQYHFYPTWSPDGNWIAFASSTYTLGGPKSESNPNALLRLVRATGGPYACPGPQCYELTNGTRYTPADAAAGRGRQSTWPKFTPFAQGDGGNLMFMSMSSRIDYGFHPQMVGDDGHSQLWLFAVDVGRVGSGDPSYAPIWLPYQDLLDGSLSPYWATTLPCQTDPMGGCAGCVGEEACLVLGETCYCSAD